MRTTGAADASFTPSAGVAVDLGPEPLVVSTSLLIGIAGVEPAVDTPYAILGDTALRISDGNGILGDEPPVSGLEIETGATLTLPITNTMIQAAELDFTHDVVNDGVLTVADVDATLRGSIDLVAGGSYHGTGPVQTHGTVPGQSGGYIRIFVEGAGYNSGPFTTYGADRVGGNGGDGGEIVFRTDWATQGEQIENTGRMDTHGGRASNGSGIGGDGGDISILPYLHLWSSGDLISRGGDGVQGGGRGGAVRIAGYYRGELRNTGHVTANGGHTSSGAAGDGGAIELEAWGGDLVSSGTLSARGGNSVGGGGIGGGGGAIALYVTSSDDNWEPVPLDVPAGDLIASGAMDASGGTATGPGGQGGAGGAIQLQIENDVTMGTQSIFLHGYGLIDTRAGNGYMAGSSPGASFDVAAVSGTRTGPIVVDASVDTSGGDADPGLAGSTGGDAGGSGET
ncbi:MAG TPA: hypothetical protein ENO23_05830, partial [Alphaproteobacteria bacterium]|nr:hypothetical protein [Alphaproteobacteria bacterium]